MRGLGWTTRTVLHEMRALHLRKMRAQFANADTAALKAAADRAGHRSTSTTENNYTGERSLANDNVIVVLPGVRAA